MMRLLGILSIAFLVSYCGTRPETEPEPAPITLVAMMQDIQNDASQLRERILQGDTLFTELKLAHDFTKGIPSSPDKNDRNFSELSDAFKLAYASIATQEQPKKEAFNLMISSCLDCHTTFCPGPIRQIKRLYITP
jgi:hypothetical protein